MPPSPNFPNFICKSSRPDFERIVAVIMDLFVARTRSNPNNSTLNGCQVTFRRNVANGRLDVVGDPLLGNSCTDVRDTLTVGWLASVYSLEAYSIATSSANLKPKSQLHYMPKRQVPSPWDPGMAKTPRSRRNSCFGRLAFAHPPAGCHQCNPQHSSTSLNAGQCWTHPNRRSRNMDGISSKCFTCTKCCTFFKAGAVLRASFVDMRPRKRAAAVR